MKQVRRKIKVKFVGFQNDKINGIELNQTWLYKTLEKHYDIELSENPDYVICSCFNLYEYCQYPQIRIMFSGENYVPDFNLIDYAVSAYPIDFLDRNFYLPQSLFGYDGERMELENRPRKYTKEFVASKTRFANFIASYDSEYNLRGDFFKKLSAVKKVDSAGNWLNNTGEFVRFQDNSKADFQRQCKFSLCFESTANAGFNTEKIMDAFYADTIPVYYGDSNIASIFNPKAFINVADFADFEEAIEKILEIDADDDKYLEMMNQPIFNEENYISKTYRGAEEFLLHIFEQPIEEARRRSQIYWPLKHDKFVRASMPWYQNVHQGKFRKRIRHIKRTLRKKLRIFLK